MSSCRQRSAGSSTRCSSKANRRWLVSCSPPQDASDLTDEEVVGRQRQLAEVVRSVEVPDGLAVSALSLELLLEDNEIGGEIPLPGGMGLVNIALNARNGWSSQSGWKLVGPLS